MTDYYLIFVSFLVSSVVGIQNTDTHNTSIKGKDNFLNVSWFNRWLYDYDYDWRQTQVSVA